MRDTSGRLLRLLSLLQSRRDWTAAELAARLDVTSRTIRKDVDRLRRLGYSVDARPGVAGGYRLGHGGSLPPLLLDDDEALAIVLGLRTATGNTAGFAEASVRALAKLQQVLPVRLRHRADALGQYTVATPPSGPSTDPAVLTEIALACRGTERLRFDYRSHEGTLTRRDVEPYRLLQAHRRWYLLAWDVERADWRTFRVDRVTPRTPGGPRFTPRPLPPDQEITARLARGVAVAPWHYRARVVVHTSADHVRRRMPVAIEVRPAGPDRCEFTPGSDDPQTLAAHLGLLGVDFTVVDAPELAEALDRLADRFRRAARGARTSDASGAAVDQ